MNKVNWLDRTIEWVNPRWGLRRLRARSAANVMLAYEGARVDRRASGWFAIDSAANSEIGPSLTWLRRRSRDLVRNTSYGTRGLNELSGHAVGTGLTVQSRAKDPALRKQIDDAWKIWVDECDAEGQLDFYGLQRLAVRSVIEGGECLVRLRPRYSTDGFHVPFQIQTLEPDYLDLNKTQMTEPRNAGYIIQGVEFDLLGRRAAYWLYKNHPGEVLIPWVNADNLRSQRVDAKYVLHLYQKDRCGQVRGVPWLAPVIINMRDLDDYNEAELVRKKIEACFAAFVTQPEASEGPTLGKTHERDHQEVETMEPGMIRYMEPGEDVKFGSPAGSGSGYREFMRGQETRIAAGIGLTYEQLTGDLSNINYSSFKAGQISFRTHMDAFRWLTLIPMFCAPIRRWFIDMAFAAGRISEPDYRSEWHCPRYGSVDEEKDIRAMKGKVRSGVQTWPQAVSAEGYDPDEQIEQIKQANKKLDDAEIVLDCDPRQRTDNGGNVNKAQQGGDAANPETQQQESKQ
jgi:lambda family phage portal protein